MLTKVKMIMYEYTVNRKHLQALNKKHGTALRNSLKGINRVPQAQESTREKRSLEII